MNTFIVGRAIGGIGKHKLGLQAYQQDYTYMILLGANGLYLGAITIVARFTSSNEKSVYFSFFGISWGIGTLYVPSFQLDQLMLAHTE